MRRALGTVGLCLLVAACGDDRPEAVDAPLAPPDGAPPVDAGVADAHPADAVPADAGAVSLTFAVVTDVHIGTGHDVYGGEEDDVTARARAAVARINAQAAVEPIDYVFILGDVSDSAEPAELAKAREILDDLSVPWVPLLGNHDVWTYTATTEETAPTGDEQFIAEFGDRYAGLVWTSAPTWNPAGYTSHFVNFEIRVPGTVLLALDWNSREHAVPGYPGALPEADLHDFGGGSFPWLETRLSVLPPSGRVIFLQHHPFRPMVPLPSWAACFSSDEMAQFRAALAAAAPVDRYWGVFAGHLHRAYQGTAFDEWPTFAQIETDASMDSGAVTLVHVPAVGAVDVSSLE